MKIKNLVLVGIATLVIAAGGFTLGRTSTADVLVEKVTTYAQETLKTGSDFYETIKEKIHSDKNEVVEIVKEGTAA